MKGERSFLLCNVHMVFQGNLGTILKSTLREMKKKNPKNSFARKANHIDTFMKQYSPNP